MNSFNKQMIQIAGVIDQAEADLLIDCGVKFIGFPLRLPVNKEDILENEAKKIISTFPKDINAVLITYLNKAKDIFELSEFLGTNYVQIHGDINIDELIILKGKNRKIKILKSIVVGKDDVDYSLKTFSNYVDFFITDTFDPKSGASGATGKTHNWDISKSIVEKSSLPVILAGGLNHKNVAEAIKHVKPIGVDVHTGVENNSGRKSRELLIKFVSEAEKAFDDIGE